jgi:hypothetical protein
MKGIAMVDLKSDAAGEYVKSIYAASIALQAHQHMRDGHGPASPEDMVRFMKEATAITKIWEEVVQEKVVNVMERVCQEACADGWRFKTTTPP